MGGKRWRRVISVAVLAVIIVGVLFLRPQSAHAADITVDGVTCTLAEAIISANSDADFGGCVNTGGPYGADLIILNADVNLAAAFGGSTTIGGGQAGLPDITSASTIPISDITIRSGSAPANTTISGNNTNFRIFYVSETGSLTLDGITVQNGQIDPGSPGQAAYGGGIFVDSGVAGSGILNVTNGSVIQNNTALGSSCSTDGCTADNGHGGGIYNNGGTVTVSSGSFIADNLAQGGDATCSTGCSSGAGSGGGLYNNGGSVTVTGNSLFQINNALRGTCSGGCTLADHFGGCAIYNGGAGTVDTTDSTFTGNTSNDDGGAIYNGINGTVIVSNSTFETNFAGDDGGAIESNGGGLVAVNTSTFQTNLAADEVGGAINNEGSSTTNVTNSSFSNNIAADDGGAIHTEDTGPVTVTGSLRGNQLGILAPPFSSGR